MNTTGKSIELSCVGTKPVVFENTTGQFAIAITTMIINIVSSIFATVSNSLVLIALYRLKQHRTPSNLLLASMCVTDFLAGLIAEPLYVALRTFELLGINCCPVTQVSSFTGYICSGASLFTLCLISVDRWFAITQPLRYRAASLSQIYMIAVALVWTFCLLFVFLYFAEVIPAVMFHVSLPLTILPLVLIALMCYIRIYRIARHHERRIQAVLEVSATRATPEFETGTTVGASLRRRPLKIAERRKSKIVLLIVAVFVICYLPKASVLVEAFLVNRRSRLTYIPVKCSETLLFLNSSFNPLIYCLKMTNIRREVVKMYSDIKALFNRDV